MEKPEEKPKETATTTTTTVPRKRFVGRARNAAKTSDDTPAIEDGAVGFTSKNLKKRKKKTSRNRNVFGLHLFSLSTTCTLIYCSIDIRVTTIKNKSGSKSNSRRNFKRSFIK